MAGPKGDIGYTGLSGPQGETGVQGSTGLQGPRGEAGIGTQGIQGLPGDRVTKVLQDFKSHRSLGEATDQKETRVIQVFREKLDHKV